MSSFFKKIGNFVTSAISSGPKIPYELHEEVGKNGLWKIFQASKDENKYTAFFYDKTKSKNRLEEDLVRHEVKQIRSLRHPGIVHYIYSFENEEQILMVTEPLSLLNLREETEITKLFGCYNILKALNFLHDNNMFHFHINPEGIFVDEKKMWKLGSLGFLSKIEDAYTIPEDFPIEKFSKVYPRRFLLYNPPELNMKKWKIICKYPHSLDIYSYGVLLFDVFENATIDHVDQILRSQLRNLPKTLRRNFMKQVLHSNPSKRPSSEEILKNSAFKHEVFELFEFIERVPVEQDISTLETNLNLIWKFLDKFPNGYVQLRILPQLFHALLFGAGQLQKNNNQPNQPIPENSVQSRVQPQLKMYQIVFRIGSEIGDSQTYRKLMIPSLYKILCSTDSMPIYHQIKVIEQIGQIVPHAEQQFLSTKIYPILLSGLSQSRSSNLREACVKSVVPLIPCLSSEKQILGELVPQFFNLQKDQKNSVRANAVIAVGLMTPALVKKDKAIIDQFVLPFYARTLKFDNFVHSKIYTLKALKATMKDFNFVQICRSVLPVVSPWLISRNKEIREIAYECFHESSNLAKKPFEDSTIENILNDELGVIDQPQNSSQPSSITSAGSKTGRLKNWASTLFLGKDIMEEEAEERKKNEGKKVQKEKQMERDRQWEKERHEKEMEEFRKKQKYKKTQSLQSNISEETDDNNEYVEDFLRETAESPNNPKPTLSTAKSYNQNSHYNNNNNSESAVPMRKKSRFEEEEEETTDEDNKEEEEDWGIGWGNDDVFDEEEPPKKKEKVSNKKIIPKATIKKEFDNLLNEKPKKSNKVKKMGGKSDEDWGIGWGDNEFLEEKTKNTEKKNDDNISKKGSVFDDHGNNGDLTANWGDMNWSDDEEIKEVSEKKKKVKKKVKDEKSMYMLKSEPKVKKEKSVSSSASNDRKKKIKKKKNIANEFDGLINFDDF